MDMNFDAKVTWEYGWKHFFGFQDEKLENSDDTLFICIVRNLPDWLNSLYRYQWHLALRHKKGLSEERKLHEFLNEEVWSTVSNKAGERKEIMQDRNIYTGERYKNIFELRHTKIKWMLEDLPNKVKNYVFIRYEDLVDDFDATLLKIKNKGLDIKEGISFPLNTDEYKDTKRPFIQK
jgi:hypothetical protein